MGCYQYTIKSISALKSKIYSFFETGEIGSCLFIRFKKSSCFIQFAITGIDDGRIHYEYGLPESDWSVDKMDLFIDFFKTMECKIKTEVNESKGIKGFLRVFFHEESVTATNNVLKVVLFFVDSFLLHDLYMHLTLEGEFYGNRLYQPIENAFIDLEKNRKLGTIGKLIHKLLKWSVKDR